MRSISNNMKKEKTSDELFAELASLFFTTRQIIRQQVPDGGKADPNAWQRAEILKYVAKAKEPTMHDVADYLRVKAPSATSLIANLDKAGMIVRTSGSKDKRVVRISLTAKGRSAVAAATARSGAMMRGAFAKLTAQEVEQLAAILRRLRDSSS